jgi:NAD(P)-dependent dehydrogenase (short-subunit alcohol dehydrogenase family)
MDYRLKGKCCFVTAGANGIGAAIAKLLTAEGASVIVADRPKTSPILPFQRPVRRSTSATGT